MEVDNICPLRILAVTDVPLNGSVPLGVFRLECCHLPTSREFLATRLHNSTGRNSQHRPRRNRHHPTMAVPAIVGVIFYQIIPIAKARMTLTTHRRELACPVQQELRALVQSLERFDGRLTLDGFDNGCRTFGLYCAALDLQTNHRSREGAFKTVEPGDEFDRRQIFRHATGEQIVDGLDV